MFMPDNTAMDLENEVERERAYCEHCILRANGKFDTEISELVYYLTENYQSNPSKIFDDFTHKIDEFFKSIISALKRFVKSVDRNIEQKLRTASMKAQFRELNRMIEKKKREGVKDIEMVDVWTLEKKIKDYYYELHGRGKKIIKNKYTSINKLDADMKEFDMYYDMFMKDLEKISSKKIKVSVEKAGKWAQAAVTGKRNIVDQMNDYIKQLEDMEAEVLRMEDMRDIKGAEILPQKTGAIRKIGTALSNFIHNTIGKMIPKVIAVVVAIFV